MGSDLAILKRQATIFSLISVNLSALIPLYWLSGFNSEWAMLREFQLFIFAITSAAMFCGGMYVEHQRQIDRHAATSKAKAADQLHSFGHYGKVVSVDGDTCIVQNIGQLKMRVQTGVIEPAVGDHFVLIAGSEGVTLGFQWPDYEEPK